MSKQEDMIKKCHYTYCGFFTKYSLLDNYGFISGLLSRIYLKILPPYLPKNSVEIIIRNLQRENNGHVPQDKFLKHVDIEHESLNQEIHHSILSLSSKILAFGLDKNIKFKFEILKLDSNLFIELNRLCGQRDDEKKTLEVIDKIKVAIEDLRIGKKTLGTSLQMTYSSRIILKYLERLILLVQLQFDQTNTNIWNSLLQDYTVESKKNKSVLFYLKYHFNLLLLQVVEHTAFKGEKYVASNRKEHIQVLVKSMKAGIVISIFALLKVYFNQLAEGLISSALLFGINYALCFIIVKEIGGIIATKQPAMTASTIAKYIDKNNDYKIERNSDIISLIKNVFRTQSISFLGNVIIVIPVSIIILFLLNSLGYNFVDPSQSIYLRDTIDPKYLTNIYYAAIAGIFLSLSGLVAGFVDNKVRFSRFEDRLKDTKLFNFIFNKHKASVISKKISKGLGAHTGNIILGLLLGFAFIIEKLTGFAFDIRHIAFSGANLGVICQSTSLSIFDFLYLLLGVGLIGLINFLVSFSITLFITFKTRGITLYQFLKISTQIISDFIKNPIQYFLFTKNS